MTPPAPNLETVITVVSGHALLGVRKFKWGDVVPQFSVGSQGDWIVSAPGVASMHLLLTFDGRQLHAASVTGSAPVYLQDTPIDDRWNPVSVPSELRFGQARLKVSCEPSQDASLSPAPAQLTARTAKLEPTHASGGRLDATRLGHTPSPVFARGAEAGGTQLIADYREELERRRRSSAPPAATQFQAEALPLRVLGRPSVTFQLTDVGNGAETGPAPAATTLPLAEAAPQAHASTAAQAKPVAAAMDQGKGLLNSTVAIPPSQAPQLPPMECTIAVESPVDNATEQGIDRYQPTLNSRQSSSPSPDPGVVVPVVAQPEPQQATTHIAPPAAGIDTVAPCDSVPAALAITEAPFSTISDGGALREFAASLPESPAAWSPHPFQPSLAPTEDMPLAAPEAYPSAPPSPVAMDPRLGSGEHAFENPKPPSSWVKKLTLVLFAAAAGLMLYNKLLKPKQTLMAAARLPAAAAHSAKAPASAAPAGSLLRQAAIAGSAAAPTSSGSAAPLAGNAPPPASSAPPLASSAPPPVEAKEPARMPEKRESREHAKAARAALDAAFEGRLEEAAAHYKALANSPQHELYALAAHYVEQGSVRIP